MNKSISYLFLLILSLTVNQSVNAASLSGKMLRHPSFYETPEKIIPTESAVYFLLHQQQYNINYKDYNSNKATLFRYDKSNPSEGIVAISNLYPEFPAIIRTFSYSPVSSTGIAVGEDNSVWLLPANGQPVSIGFLSSNTMPGKQHANSIIENPSDGTFWIATTFGYAQVDPVERTILKGVKTDYPVDWISPMGNKLIIFSSGKAYCADTPEAYKLKDLIELSFEAPAGGNLPNISSPENLMPLTEKSFAFFIPTEGTKRQLCVATLSGNKWTLLPLVEDEFRFIQADRAMNSQMANNGLPAKEGYLINSKNKSYLLKKGTDPGNQQTADQYKTLVISEVQKFEETDKEGGSYDFTEFWFFQPKEGFYSRSLGGSGWGSPTTPIWPSSPAPFVSTSIKYHPTFGMLLTSHGNDWLFSDVAPQVPWLVSAFKNGKWTQLSPTFHMPKEIAANDDYKQRFEKYREIYPVSQNDGIGFNPLDPDFAYTGSLNYGWARFNMANPTELPLIVANSNNSLSKLPCFVNDNPVFSSWSYLCDYSTPEFDNEGRMWSIFFDYDKALQSNPVVVLKWYSPEDLSSMKNVSTNPASFKSPGSIDVPVGLTCTSFQKVLPLRHPSNKNLLAIHLGGFGSSVTIYDHNGTPEDPSDDRMINLSKPVDSVDGTEILINNTVGMWEDETTGKVWFSTLTGTFTVDPVLALSNPEKSTSIVRVRSNENSDDLDKIAFQSVLVTDGTVDDRDNLWVGTYNAGVWCLSPDRKSILGELTAGNSMLPTNNIHGICYNPERQSLMISTSEGMVEFFPEISGATGSERVSMTPSDLTPGFHGLVTFSGLPQGKTFVITNKDGKTIKSLGTPIDGILQWDGTDSGSSPLPSGRYNLKVYSENESYLEFNVIK